MSDEFNSDVLSGMTLSRLYELARERDIKNPRKYKKQELVDLILAEDGPQVLEINAIPGLTETSLLPQAAEAAGLDFNAMVQKILDLAMA